MGGLPKSHGGGRRNVRTCTGAIVPVPSLPYRPGCTVLYRSDGTRTIAPVEFIHSPFRATNKSYDRSGTGTISPVHQDAARGGRRERAAVFKDAP